VGEQKDVELHRYIDHSEKAGFKMQNLGYIFQVIFASTEAMTITGQLHNVIKNFSRFCKK
jgi:hypothetical protein